MKEYIESEFEQISKNFIALKEKAPEIEAVANACIEALKRGNKIMFCGNGGSAADAQHLAAELVGRYKMNRKAMNAVALTTDSSVLTSLANDYGYEIVFERQVEGLGKKGDVFFGISTSGNSKNVILAMERAKDMGITTVALTGDFDGRMNQSADYDIAVPSKVTNNIQEMHIAVGHLLCGIIEKALYGGE